MKDVSSGKGPGGLGAALELDKVFSEMPQVKQHKITVLERAGSISAYDPNKGFMYLISGKGLLFTDRSVLNGNRVDTSGKITKVKFNFFPTIGSQVPYWITRHEFNSLLGDAVMQRPSITLRTSCELVDFQALSTPSPNGGHLTARVLSLDTGEEELLEDFDLIVAAEGLKSRVRELLVERDMKEQAGGAAGGSDLVSRFQMKEVFSPAGGLRYKVLKLEPSFPVAEAVDDQPRVVAVPEETYFFTSKYTGKDPKLDTRLGILPRKGIDGYRTANVITKPDHKIWNDPKLFTLDGMRSFLEDCFPQVLWKDVVKEEELERFAKSEARASYIVKDSESGAGVVLLGDALHSFPPDLGQGVNSALADALSLGKKLEDTAPLTSGSFVSALRSYESHVVAESKALVRLMQIGSPYQYNQPGLVDKLAATCMLANLLFRELLSSIPFLGKRIFWPQASRLTRYAGQWTYQEMLRKANRTTKSIFGMFAMMLASFLFFAKPF
ncbi:hypothetical protein GUITHDRAFT_164951 [Guillardia theta CCMP2712]|uniref:FAD-binding domain-containing protein n=1 Tax=Guillardia theta (strain CCMP2712) TaxID=905079 RepID=L1ITS4_GUITC|nr:hypothetical protein GUITHDRAFT_164951 [Guillardia theta CCMP2712]EKX39512.1 hypothetical protein GUITHDRAFT_164951 [Guillardia theta CCMP2712]|eukprot:XP_005826492.1 hypothetical protein GUITHDRAFT_164951 [Guillardia theta CCMP2712]